MDEMEENPYRPIDVEVYRYQRPWITRCADWWTEAMCVVLGVCACVLGALIVGMFAFIFASALGAGWFASVLMLCLGVAVGWRLK